MDETGDGLFLGIGEGLQDSFHTPPCDRNSLQDILLVEQQPDIPQIGNRT